MEPVKPMLRRCAIYTRKSSEEGLAQNFNSLHAQREGREAFIRSQAAEGWRLVKTYYDDGGLSGATMERPALKRLLEDTETAEAGRAADPALSDHQRPPHSRIFHATRPTI